MTYQFSTTASPFNDETYLEAFVESISTSLPNELKRNLDHLCDLDKTSSQLLEQWRDKQDNCYKQVEDSLVRKFRSDAAGIVDTTTRSSDTVGSNSKTDDVDGNDNDTPTATPSKLDSDQSPEKSPLSSDSPTKKKASACKKCRAKKTRCGVQPFCLNLAAGLESPNSRQGSSPKKQKVEEDPMPQISQEELTAHLLKRGPPTSKEINSILLKHNPQYPAQRQEITDMYNTLQQYSNEKMSTAHQVKSMIDMALGRIDRDLAMFERELKIGSSEGVGGGMQGMTSGSHRQQPSTSYHPQPLSTSSFAPVVPSTTTSTAPTLHRSSGLPPPTSSCQQKKQQPSTQEVEKSTVKSTNLAAIKVSPTSTEWILAKILSTENGMHTLSDEDVTSKQVYRLPVGRQVKILEDQKRHALTWNRGDDCYAIYPETTSFYRATVSTPLHNGYVGVQFRNDMDANGITHEKAVQLGHIMKRPR